MHSTMFLGAPFAWSEPGLGCSCVHNASVSFELRWLSRSVFPQINVVIDFTTYILVVLVAPFETIRISKPRVLFRQHRKSTFWSLSRTM